MRLVPIIVGLLALPLLGLPVPSEPLKPTCTDAELHAGLCMFDPATGELVVGGSIVHPAPPPDPDGPGGSGEASGSPQPLPGGATPNLDAPCQEWTDVPGLCFRHFITLPPPGDSEDAPPAPIADAVRPITMSDIERFTPIVGELVVEPEGWGVVGTPTNFYATAETHTMDGELFDSAIQVRWTPSSYIFDYGDGTVEETEASGSAWRGAEESWTETATSHMYSSTDDVTASVTVVFTAEVNAGAGWFAVPGTLPVEAPEVSVKVFEVDTVLTDGDCMANPSAAGCG